MIVLVANEIMLNTNLLNPTVTRRLSFLIFAKVEPSERLRVTRKICHSARNLEKSVCSIFLSMLLLQNLGGFAISYKIKLFPSFNRKWNRFGDHVHGQREVLLCVLSSYLSVDYNMLSQ